MKLNQPSDMAELPNWDSTKDEQGHKDLDMMCDSEMKGLRLSHLHPIINNGLENVTEANSINGVSSDLDLSNDLKEQTKSGNYSLFATTNGGMDDVVGQCDSGIIDQVVSSHLEPNENTQPGLFDENASQFPSLGSKEEADTSDEHHQCNISELQHVIERLKREKTMLEEAASECKERCQSQLDQVQREIQLLKQEHDLDVRTQARLKLEMETLKKQCVLANKETESTVMRYATSQMEVINQRKLTDSVDKKYKQALQEKESITCKLKAVMIEKAQIGQQLDNKCSELANSQKEVLKLKEEVNSRDIKIKWTQNKLKQEMESRKESEIQVEKLSAMINEAREEVEKCKKDAEIAIKEFQCSQENRAFVLEGEVREQQAELIVLRHAQAEAVDRNRQLSQRLDSLTNSQCLLGDQNDALKLTVASLEKESAEGRESVGRLSQEVDHLRPLAARLDDTTAQLAREKERAAELQSEVVELRQECGELRQRHADMLDFTQKVTAKNVRLQNEFSCVDAKVRQLECEEEPLQRRIAESQKKIEALQRELAKEKSEREDEKKLVARHLAEKTAKVETLTKKLEDLQGENQVTKHKHSATLRELTREVREYRKRLEQVEASASGTDSKTSSCGSLDAPTTVAQPAVVERILRLQRDNERLRDKVDFLEEHSKQLTAELQKKARLVQGYALRDEAGALSPPAMDANKAELARHGGVMASVYGLRAADDAISLELSLEINRKLQAVLEDTLLKNITLKENIDTLGDEICRLSGNT